MTRELMIIFSLFGLYAAWVLLPLLPAVLIYRLFPSTAVAVSGPFANLTVRASGAFAAYLIVFAASVWIVNPTQYAIAGFQKQFWIVEGEVKLLGPDGKDIKSTLLLS